MPCDLAQCKEPVVTTLAVPACALDCCTWEITLCEEHLAFLESHSQSGYSQAKPPPMNNGRWWPWKVVGNHVLEPA
jgi:hypothetical protein